MIHNVQCRIVGEKEWADHGNVSIISAMESHVRPLRAIDATVNVEARWEHEPERVWIRPVSSVVSCHVMDLRGEFKQ